MPNSSSKQKKNPGKGKDKKTGSKKTAGKKKDLVYDKTVYNDEPQAWERGESVECRPDESDTGHE